jgi:hypothetical protein
MKVSIKRWISAALIAAMVSTTTLRSQESHAMAALVTGPASTTGGILLAVGGATAAGSIISFINLIDDENSSSSEIVATFLFWTAALILLPAEGTVEFSELEYGDYGLSDEEIDIYQDMIPSLNAQARQISHQLQALDPSLSTEQVFEHSESLWNQAFNQMGVSDEQRSLLRTILETSRARANEQNAGLDDV